MAIVLIAATTAAWAEPARYEIDPAHTFPSFEVSHMGFSRHRGRFNQTRGQLVFDAEKRLGTLEVTVDTASIDTGDAALEKVLRGEGFFDAARFPEMRFVSQRFVFEGERLVAVEGSLTLLGQSRPLRLDLDFFRCGYSLLQQKPVCGANAVGVLRRSEFGMDKFVSFGLGDEVRLAVQVEALGERRESPPN